MIRWKIKINGKEDILSQAAALGIIFSPVLFPTRPICEPFGSHGIIITFPGGSQKILSDYTSIEIEPVEVPDTEADKQQSHKLTYSELVPLSRSGQEDES